MPSLMDCKGDETATAAIKRDNFDKGDFWFLSDGFKVTLAEQQSGESPTQLISVPKETFDYFVKKYTEHQ